MLVFGTFSGLFFFASIFTQQVYGCSPMTAGFAYVPLGVAVVVGAGLINTSQEAGGALGRAVIATIADSGIGAALAASGGDPALVQAAQAAPTATRSWPRPAST